MMEIQYNSIPVVMGMHDVLGVAKADSGKTLAFLVPAIELLHKLKFMPSDGIGALIISPTRELALQILEVTKDITPFPAALSWVVPTG